MFSPVTSYLRKFSLQRNTISKVWSSVDLRRKVTIGALCALLSFPVAGFAQRGVMPPPPIVQPHVRIDILSFQHPSLAIDSVREDIYFAVPFEALSFLYAVDRYVADYAAILQITDVSTGKLLLDKYQTYSIVETTSEHQQRSEKGVAHADAEQFSLSLPSNHQYEVRLLVRDLSSKHELDTVIKTRTRLYDQSTPALSDIIVYRSRAGNRILPMIGGDVPFLGGENAGIFASLYNPPIASTLGVVTEVYALKDADETGALPVIRSTELVRTPNVSGPSTASGQTQVTLFQDISFDELWMGKYVLTTYILRNAADTGLTDPTRLHAAALCSNERSLVVRTARGIPMAEADLEQSIEQLHIIATGSEWDSLSAAKTPKQQRDAILTFWHNRNPNPSDHYNRPMEVFYSRIDYANTHYSTGFQKGWKTDRGRVYIALGEPDYIDKHGMTPGQGAFEIWEYSYQHRRYTFVDAYMLGDYRLTGGILPYGTFVWDR